MTDYEKWKQFLTEFNIPFEEIDYSHLDPEPWARFAGNITIEFSVLDETLEWAPVTGITGINAIIIFHPKTEAFLTIELGE